MRLGADNIGKKSVCGAISGSGARMMRLGDIAFSDLE
jgi:hypothetical protein